MFVQRLLIQLGWAAAFCLVVLLSVVACTNAETSSSLSTAGSIMRGHGCYEARHVVILGTKVLARNELYQKNISSCKRACTEDKNCTAWSYKLPNEMQFLEMPKIPNFDEELSTDYDDEDPSCYLVYNDDLIKDLFMRYSFGATFKFRECLEVYLGCYESQVIGDYSENITLLESLSPRSCILDCKEANFAYAGLKNKSGCDCGNTFDDGKFVESSLCQIPCPSGNNDLCGGQNATSIWRTGTLGADEACVFGKVSFMDFAGDTFTDGLGHCAMHCTAENDCVAWQHNGTHCSLFTDSLEGVNLTVGNEGTIAGFGKCYGDLNLVYHTTIDHPAVTLQISNETVAILEHQAEDDSKFTLWEPGFSSKVSDRVLMQSWTSENNSGASQPKLFYTRDATNFFNQHPQDFTLIWAKNGTAFWDPVCPAKYAALGSVSTGYDMEVPSPNRSVCLHQSLLRETQSSRKIWVQNGDDAEDRVYLLDVMHNDSLLPNLSSFVATTSENFSDAMFTLRKVVQDADDPTKYLIHAKYKGIFDTKLSDHLESIDFLVITNLTPKGYRYRPIYLGFPSVEDLDYGWTTSGTILSPSGVKSIRLFRKQQGRAITPPTDFETIGTIGGYFDKIDQGAETKKLHLIRFVCPDGYHALGVAVLLNDAAFNASQYSCIHEKFLVNVSLPQNPWWPTYTPLHNVSIWRIDSSSCFEDNLGYSLAAYGYDVPLDTAYILRKHKDGEYEQCMFYSFLMEKMKNQIKLMEMQRQMKAQSAAFSGGKTTMGFSNSGGEYTGFSQKIGQEGGFLIGGSRGDSSFNGMVDWSQGTGEAGVYGEGQGTGEAGVYGEVHQSRSDASAGQSIIIPDLRVVTEIPTLLEMPTVSTTQRTPTTTAMPKLTVKSVEMVTKIIPHLSGITAEMVMKGWGCFQMRHFAFYANPVSAADIGGIHYKDICANKCKRSRKCIAWSYILDRYDKNGNVEEPSQCHHLYSDDDIGKFKVVFVKDAFMEFLTCTLGYVGCFEDKKRPRDLPDIGLSTKATIKSCQHVCGQKRSAYFGLQFGIECWCGNGFGRYQQYGSDSECFSNCREKPDEKCGGINKNSVYRTGNFNGQMCVFAQASLDFTNLDVSTFKGIPTYSCWENCKSTSSDRCIIWEQNGTHCHHVSKSQLIDSGHIRLNPKNRSYVGFSTCDGKTETQFHRINSSMEMSVKLINSVNNDVTITTGEKNELAVYSASLQDQTNREHFLLGQSFHNSTYAARIIIGEPLQTPNEMHQVLINHVKTIDRNQTATDSNTFASFWHMDCPAGYSAMGDIISADAEPPDLQNYKCIHTDFLNPGRIGEKIWGQTELDEISLWHIAPKNIQTDMDLSFFKVADHVDTPEDDEFDLKTLKKVQAESDEHYYSAQDTFEFESKLSGSFRGFNIFSGASSEGGRVKLSKPTDLEDGWFYLGFGLPFAVEADRKIPIVKNIQGNSIVKPTDVEHIVSLSGELFFKQREKSVSLWKTICPQNYKALSDIFQVGNNKPALANLACIHQNLLVPARTADVFWDSGGGLITNNSHNYALVHIMPQECEEGEDFGFFKAMKDEEDIEVYTLRRNSEVDNSLYPKCVNWVPPTEMVHIEESILEPELSLKDIFVTGGMRQSNILMKDIVIDAQNGQNYSDVNICKEKCEYDMECVLWSFDMFAAAHMEQQTCFHVYFNSSISNVTIEHKTGAIMQSQRKPKADLIESCMLLNATVLVDSSATLSSEDLATSDCKRSCLGCIAWTHNGSHCIIMHKENFNTAKAIIPKLDHTIGFPECNHTSYLYFHNEEMEDSKSRASSMIMEAKEFSGTKSYLILKNDTGKLNLWTPNLDGNEWKIIGQKVDTGKYDHDDKIFAARIITGMPMAKPISASLVASVSGYRRHHHQHDGIETNITVWKLICPQGYKSLGDVMVFHHHPNLTNYACIKDEFVAHGGLGKRIFSASGGSILYEIRPRVEEDGMNAEFYTFSSPQSHEENLVYVLKMAPGGFYYSYGQLETAALATTYAMGEETTTTTTAVATTGARGVITTEMLTKPHISSTASPSVTTISDHLLAMQTTLQTQVRVIEMPDTTEHEIPPFNVIVPDGIDVLSPNFGWIEEVEMGSAMTVGSMGWWGCFWKHNAMIKGKTKSNYSNLDYKKCKDTCASNVRCIMWSLVPESSGSSEHGSNCNHVYAEDDISSLKIVPMNHAHLGFTTCNSGYVGCHSGQHDKDIFHFVGESSSESSCLEECKKEKYPYAGLQPPNRCMCASLYDDILLLNENEKCNLDTESPDGTAEKYRYAIHRTGSNNADGELCIIGKHIDYWGPDEEEDFVYEEAVSLLACHLMCLGAGEEKCWMWSYNNTHCRLIDFSQKESSFVTCDDCILGFRTCNEKENTKLANRLGPGAMHHKDCSKELSFLIAFLIAIALLLIALIYICCKRRRKMKRKYEVETLSQNIKVGSKLDAIDLKWPKQKKKKVKMHRNAIRRSNLPLLLRLSSKQGKSGGTTVTEQLKSETHISETGDKAAAVVAVRVGMQPVMTSEKMTSERIVSQADVHIHEGETNFPSVNFAPVTGDFRSDYITIEGNQGYLHGSSAAQTMDTRTERLVGQYSDDLSSSNISSGHRSLSKVFFNVNQPYHSYNITPQDTAVTEIKQGGALVAQGSAELSASGMGESSLTTSRQIGESRSKAIVALQYQPKYNVATAEHQISLGSQAAAYHEVRVLDGNESENEFRTKRNITSVVEQYGFIPIDGDDDFTVKLEDSNGSVA